MLAATKICMTISSNGNIFRVTGPLSGEFTGEFPSQRPVTRSLVIFFDLCLNKRLSKQSWGWWFETPLRSLWRHCNVRRIITNFAISWIRWIHGFVKELRDTTSLRIYLSFIQREYLQTLFFNPFRYLRRMHFQSMEVDGFIIHLS